MLLTLIDNSCMHSFRLNSITAETVFYMHINFAANGICYIFTICYFYIAHGNSDVIQSVSIIITLYNLYFLAPMQKDPQLGY